MENRKVCMNTCYRMRVTTINLYVRCILFDIFYFRNVDADIRVRIDGVEDEHGIIKVDKNGKVCKTHGAFIWSTTMHIW